MSKVRLLSSTRNLQLARACAGALGLLIALLAPAFGQSGADFTVSLAPFPPPQAMLPGGTSSAAITVSPQSGFSGTIDFTCHVTPQPTNFPGCQVSPSSVTLPNDTANATVTTTGSTPAGQYAFVVTGTSTGPSGTTSASSEPEYLTVESVAPNFTISVTRQVEPGTVHAGNGGQGTVSLTPNGGYSGTVTLSCATVIPLVTTPPTCSFNNPVNVPGTPATITINTTGPNNQPPSAQAGRVHGFWMPVLALAGLGMVSGRRLRRAWCLLAVFVLAASILLTPSCGNSGALGSSNPNASNSVITPKNTYTFTVTGIDDNGVVPSNTGTSAPTVTLTVN